MAQMLRWAQKAAIEMTPKACTIQKIIPIGLMVLPPNVGSAVNTTMCVCLLSTSSTYLPVVLTHACYHSDTDMIAAKASSKPCRFSNSMQFNARPVMTQGMSVYTASTGLTYV